MVDAALVADLLLDCGLPVDRLELDVGEAELGNLDELAKDGLDTFEHQAQALVHKRLDRLRSLWEHATAGRLRRRPCLVRSLPQ